MKSVNLICKVEIISEYEKVKKAILDFCGKYSEYDYNITICVPYNSDIKEDGIKIVRANENQSLEDVVNNEIALTTEDYAVCMALNNKNWEHNTIKVIENLSSGVDVCKVSKLFLPKSLFWGVINTIIRIYYMCISLFIVSDRTLGATDKNYQGYSQKAIIIMKNFREKMFNFRNEDCFLLLSQKNLFLKKDNKSEKIEHLSKKSLTKKQIASLVTIFITIIIIILTFPLMLKVYIKEGEVLKFIILNMIILALGISVAFYLFFSDEAKKITM